MSERVEREPSPIRCGDLILRFGERPYLMGILNATPDSFSDGGDFADSARAVDRALAMAEQGADIIDVGGESSRPGAQPISAAEEMDRVVPIIERVSRYSRTPISIDTTKASVAAAALDAGAVMINDISAGAMDEGMFPLVAERGVPLVIMHMRGEPRTMQKGDIVYDDLIGEISAHLKMATDRAVRAGVNRSSIIWDPGIGFGKTVKHNLMLLNRLGAFKKNEQAILIGPSRKAFIGQILNLDVKQRLYGTAAAVSAAVLAGAQIVRVHDVAEMRQVALVAHAIRREA